MGANGSTRRVSFESDDKENITVVKGIRLSENVINRMRDGGNPPPALTKPHTPMTPPPSPPPLNTSLTPSPPPFLPVLRPVRPLFDPLTSMPPVAKPLPPTPPPITQVEAPAIVQMTLPCPPPSPPPPAPPVVAVAAPPAAVVELPQVQPLAPAPVPEPPQPQETVQAPPTAVVPAVDEEALRRRISEELNQGLQQERAKAEQELQAWLEAEKAVAVAEAQAEARSRVQPEVTKLLAVERGVSRVSLQQAVLRERDAADEEKFRAQRYAKQLEAREAELKKQDAFYREQVARLEERSAQFYKVTTENYHNAMDQLSSKFRRYEAYPVCTDLQAQVLQCYQENPGRTLQCSSIAALYLQCVNGSKLQTKLRTGG